MRPRSGRRHGWRWDYFVEFARSANSTAKNRHGGRFLAAQGIEAEILVARVPGNKIGADSPVSGVLKKRRKCARKGQNT
jgi:hypothetical protein